MTVCRQIAVAFALAVALLGAGCSRGAKAPLVPESEDRDFVSAQQLKRQGKHPEALAMFLKVIKQRGEQESAESHLDAGIIYLENIKDPLAAIYHFKEFLLLRPTARQADLVRQQIAKATRIFASSLPMQPPADFGFPADTEEVQRLRQENAELKAQLATLRGGGAAPMPVPPRGVLVPQLLAPSSQHSAPANDSPIMSVPPPVASANLPMAQTTPQPAPQNLRGPAPRPPTTGSGRTHTISAGDSLWKIARQYYGTADNAKVEAIFQANRDVMRDTGDLKAGATLRIP